jgi:phage baseplate assembly protein gpV
MSFIGDTLLKHAREIARLDRQAVTQRLSGKVVERDPETKRVRLALGEDPETGEVIKSPWVRVQSQSAGAHKAFVLPSVGEQMTLESEGGRMGANSVARYGTHDDENPHPASEPDAYTHTVGNATMTLKDGLFKFSVGSSELTMVAGQITIKADVVQINGTTLKHNAKNIGDSHAHVTAPPGPPGPPV